MGTNRRKNKRKNNAQYNNTSPIDYLNNDNNNQSNNNDITNDGQNNQKNLINLQIFEHNNILLIQQIKSLEKKCGDINDEKDAILKKYVGLLEDKEKKIDDLEEVIKDLKEKIK